MPEEVENSQWNTSTEDTEDCGHCTHSGRRDLTSVRQPRSEYVRRRADGSAEPRHCAHNSANKSTCLCFCPSYPIRRQ